MTGSGTGSVGTSTEQRDTDATGVPGTVLEGVRSKVFVDRYSLKDAHLQVPPYQLPTMEMVAAATISPSGPTLAGELGLGMINFGGTSQAVFDAVKDHWAVCQAE